MLKTYFLKYWDDQARDYFFMTVKLRQNLKEGNAFWKNGRRHIVVEVCD